MFSYELNHRPGRHMREDDVLARLDNCIQYAARREGRPVRSFVLVNQDFEYVIDDVCFRGAKVVYEAEIGAVLIESHECAIDNSARRQAF
jgi:hypothetical protein